MMIISVVVSMLPPHEAADSRRPSGAMFEMRLWLIPHRHTTTDPRAQGQDGFPKAKIALRLTEDECRRGDGALIAALALARLK
jgi:hypothetical protein